MSFPLGRHCVLSTLRPPKYSGERLLYWSEIVRERLSLLPDDKKKIVSYPTIYFYPFDLAHFRLVSRNSSASFVGFGENLSCSDRVPPKFIPYTGRSRSYLQRGGRGLVMD